MIKEKIIGTTCGAIDIEIGEGVFLVECTVKFCVPDRVEDDPSQDFNVKSFGNSSKEADDTIEKWIKQRKGYGWGFISKNYVKYNMD